MDQWRLILLEHRAIELWHHLYQLREQGVLSDADRHVHTWIMRNIGRRQAEAWKVFAHVGGVRTSPP